MGTYIISGSPHIHERQDVSKMMWNVVYALIPAFLVSIYYFGWQALMITLVSIVSCVLFEFLLQRFVFKSKELTIKDGSAVITGMLLAFNVPSSLPWWEMVIGSLVAIGVAKMTFGGLGKNIFNPALVGRVFLLISFPVEMTTWPMAVPLSIKYADVITGPTSLGIIKEGLKNGDNIQQLMYNVPSYMDMFIGNMGGSLGEVSAIVLILGGIYLLLKNIITWHIPVSYILTVFIFTGILWLINPEQFADPVFHLLAGGLLLGAIFMATDLVTSPVNHRAQLIYGVGCGLLTVLIRIWGAYPEGVSFAILIMNAVTPLLNRYIKPKRFGVHI